jgi:hypothetical protein
MLHCLTRVTEHAASPSSDVADRFAIEKLKADLEFSILKITRTKAYRFLTTHKNAVLIKQNFFVL